MTGTHRIPVIVLIPVIILCAALVLALWVPVTASAQDDGFGPPPVPSRTLPKIRIDNPEFDWGKILQGEKQRHTYKIRNDGNGPLRINNVKSSCGCTTVDWTKIVEPGKFGEVTLEINTTKLRTKHVRKYATINCNDPKSPKTKVFIGGDLIQIIEHSPRVVKLSGLAGDVMQTKITVTPGTDTAIQVTDAKPRARHIQVLNIQEVERGMLYEITIQAMPSQRPAKLRDNLELTVITDDGHSRKTSIQVIVDHRDRIQLQPRGNVVFQRKDTARLRTGTTPVTRPIIISAGGPEVTFKIIDLQLLNVPEGLFDYKLDTLQEGKRYKVTLRCLRDHDQRFVRGELVIGTDDPQVPNRKVRVFAQFGNVVTKAPVRRGRPAGPKSPAKKKQ